MSTSRATFYNSILGEAKNKFDNSKHRKTNSITDQTFFQWTQNNMYRTSYNDMANRVSFIFHESHNLN